MKKTILVIIAAITLSCSSEEDAPENNLLTSFEEPYTDFDANEDKIIEVLGEPDRINTSSEFDFGKNLYYNSENTGIIHTMYLVNGFESLMRIEVRIIASGDNLEFIKNWLQKNYGEPEISESALFDTVNYSYATERMNIILSYADKNPVFADIIYREKP